jgi:hypothetical protein
MVLVLASQGGTAAQQASDRAADVAAMRKHIESICQAFVDKDRKKLEDTHGKDWSGFTPWSEHVIRGRDGYMNEATFAPGSRDSRTTRSISSILSRRRSLGERGLSWVG